MSVLTRFTHGGFGLRRLFAARACEQANPGVRVSALLSMAAALSSPVAPQDGPSAPQPVPLTGCEPAQASDPQGAASFGV